MKKTIGILIALALVCISALALADVAVDAAHFPDDNFRDYVSDEFDKDGNGSLSAAEIAAAETIDCHGKGIENLQGIEYFTAAKELLCYSNSLKTLNVSSNKALVYLNCWDNQLTALNVSALTELEDLRCSKNQFTSLNLSANTKLKELRAYEGKLVSLNLSGCTLLEYVEVNQNAISSLTFGSHPALNYLDVWANKLTSLNVTGFPKLKFLRCTDNQISSLDTSANTNLQELICYQNPITTLDVSKNRKLIKLDLAETPTLKSLSVANNPNLMELWVYDTALTTLDISNCRYMSEVYKTDPEEINGGAVLNYHDDSIHACLVVDKTLKIISNPTGIALDAANFPDAVFRQAVSAFDTDKNGALSTGEIKQVTKFSCSGKGIKSLEGIENLSALTNLDCSSNNLKKLDVSGNLNLVTLNCSNNKISDLELGRNVNLRQLYSHGNIIKKLNVKNVSQLSKVVNQHGRTIKDGYDLFYRKETTTNFDQWGQPTSTTEKEFFLYVDHFTTVVADGKTSPGTSGQAPDPEYTITVTNDGNGSGTASPSSGTTGTKVTLTAIPNKNYRLKEWVVVEGNVTIASNAFTIGEDDVIVRATFEKVSSDPGDNPGDNPGSATSGGAVLSINQAAGTATVTGVDGNATSVVIPDTINGYKVTEIAANAFKGKNIKKVKIGKNVKTIGKNAFNNCKNLESVSGGNGIETIGDGAFQKCVKLKAITLGKKVKKIGKNAFNGCKALAKVTVKTALLTKKTLGKSCFKGLPKKVVFKVPKKQKALYKEIFVKTGKAPKTATFK